MTSISSLVCFFKSQQTVHRAAAPRHKSRSATLKTMSHRRNKQVQLLNIKHSVLITQNFSLHCEELKCLPVIPRLHIASFPVYPFCGVSVTVTETWPCSNGFQEKGICRAFMSLSDSVRRQKAKTGHRWHNFSTNKLKCNEETEVFRSHCECEYTNRQQSEQSSFTANLFSDETAAHLHVYDRVGGFL